MGWVDIDWNCNESAKIKTFDALRGGWTQIGIERIKCKNTRVDALRDKWTFRLELQK